MADTSLRPTTCTEGQLQLLDMIEPITDWEEALKVAFTFALTIIDVKCADPSTGPHRILWAVSGVIDSMTDAELEGLTPTEYAQVARDQLTRQIKSRGSLRGAVNDFIRALDRVNGFELESDDDSDSDTGDLNRKERFVQ